MGRLALALALAFPLVLAAPVAAQSDQEPSPTPAPAPSEFYVKPAPDPPPPPAGGAAPGFVADLLGDFGGAARRLVQLAEAMPADKYGWRPAAGVRTFSEVLMHVAAGNYLAAASLGAATPEGIDPMNLEAITDRAQAIATLRASLAHFERAAMAVDPATLDEEVTLFGGNMGKRRVLLLMQGHAHEHAGQAIAYARMNGVVPPWSRGGDGG